MRFVLENCTISNSTLSFIDYLHFQVGTYEGELTLREYAKNVNLRKCKIGKITFKAAA